MGICKKNILFLIIFNSFWVQDQKSTVLILPAVFLEESYNPKFLHYRYLLINEFQVVVIKKKAEYSKKDSVQFIRTILQNGRPDLLVEFEKENENNEEIILNCPYCNRTVRDFPLLWYHFSFCHSEYLDKEKFYLFDPKLHKTAL